MTHLPREKRARLILNTDAKNEADDQFTIVHALLTPTFDFHSIIAAHFGDGTYGWCGKIKLDQQKNGCPLSLDVRKKSIVFWLT